MDDNYKKFCIKCYWNGLDFGCIVESSDRIYQCEMYRFYHPEEVREWEEYLSKKYIFSEVEK